MVWVKLDNWVVRLGGLLPLGSSDGLDGAECSVEPGLLGGLHLVEGQTQVVLQVLIEEGRTAIVTITQTKTSLTVNKKKKSTGHCVLL